MRSPSRIYLDYNATTPVDPQVLDAMLPYFSEVYGNPANGYHWQGRQSAKAIEKAREQVADLVGAEPYEIFFTSGATESNNIVLQGFPYHDYQKTQWHLITSKVEHKSVLEPCKTLAETGVKIILLPVTHSGIVSVEDNVQILTGKRALLSLHLANNEIGTIQDIRRFSEIVHECNGIFHSDATQAVGKILFKVNDLGIDLASFSAHKLYGPKGVGALYIRGGTSKIPLRPLSFGGGQENGIRPGTMNVSAIVGFGEACAMSSKLLESEPFRQRSMREMFEAELQKSIPALIINCKDATRLPNTTSITFEDIDGDAFLANVPGVMMGTGSACSSGAMEPSHVLQAIGLSRDQATRTIRVSLGRYTTEDDIRSALAQIIEAYKNLHSI